MVCFANGGSRGGLSYGALVEDTLEAVAAHLERHLNVDGLLALTR